MRNFAIFNLGTVVGQKHLRTAIRHAESRCLDTLQKILGIRHGCRIHGLPQTTFDQVRFGSGIEFQHIHLGIGIGLQGRISTIGDILVTITDPAHE